MPLRIPQELIDQEAIRLTSEAPDKVVPMHPVEKEKKGLPPAWWAGLIGANGADAATTYGVLKQGGREHNPLVRGLAQHPAAFALTKLGIGAGTAFGLDKMHKNHPKAAKIAAAISTAIPAIAALHNLRNLR